MLSGFEQKPSRPLSTIATLRSDAVLSTLLLSLVMVVAGVIAADATGTVTLDAGENYLTSSSAGATTRMYFGTQTSPGRVVKLAYGTLTRTAALTLNTGENNLTSAVSDGTYSYFGT